MSLREFHRPTDPNGAASLLRRTHTITRPIFLGPRPVALYEQEWEAAVDLSGLGLVFIKRDPDNGIRIGALTPLQDVSTAQDLQDYACGLLPCSARLSAHLGLRNAANLAGVLSTVDGAPEIRVALMVLAAETISTDGFITEIRLPAQTLLTSLQRVARTPMDEAIVAVAVGLKREDNVVARARIAVSGIGHIPVRLKSAEGILASQTLTPNLIDKVSEAAMTAANPVYSDYRGSAEYRREMAGVLTRRAIEIAWQREANE